MKTGFGQRRVCRAAGSVRAGKTDCRASGAVGRIRRRNVFHRNGEEQENREWINRIFAKEYFHYEGRIHEQVTRHCVAQRAVIGRMRRRL